MFEKILEFILKALAQGLVFTGFATIIVFIFREQFKAIIQSSVKYFFDKKLEDYKAKEIKRQKAVLVADLISEWISFPEDRKKLNQLTLEAFIWLPKESAIKLSGLLSLSHNAPNVREIVSEIREIILGESEKIDPNIIILFPPKEKNKTPTNK